MSIRFEWDPAKNDANQRKHGLRFEDAKPQERARAVPPVQEVERMTDDLKVR
jgi:uncharacterized DUF497 family protein